LLEKLVNSGHGSESGLDDSNWHLAKSGLGSTTSYFIG